MSDLSSSLLGPWVRRFLLEHYPVKRQLAIDLEELDQMDVVAEWLARQGRQAVYVPLPDRPLAERDAEAALDAVGRALIGQPAAFDAQIKAETMKTFWVPGVNNLGGFGRWAFAEFTDVYAIQAAFGRLVDDLTASSRAAA